MGARLEENTKTMAIPIYKVLPYLYLWLNLHIFMQLCFTSLAILAYLQLYNMAVFISPGYIYIWLYLLISALYIYMYWYIYILVNLHISSCVFIYPAIYTCISPAVLVYLQQYLHNMPGCINIARCIGVPKCMYPNETPTQSSVSLILIPSPHTKVNSIYSCSEEEGYVHGMGTLIS